MHISALDYELPPSAIAQRPAEPRESARLLVDRGEHLPPAHLHVADLPRHLGEGDVVVVNTSRVLPARIIARKPSGGRVEVLLLERRAGGWWEALVRPGRRVPPGSVLEARGQQTAPLGGPEPGQHQAAAELEVGERLGGGVRLVRFPTSGTEESDIYLLSRIGQIPLPPYIREPLDDPERYQTVFAANPGSVAAPTAGLHLTSGLIEQIRDRGAQVATIDLAVGIGTFRPIDSKEVGDHRMHAERFRVPPETMEACQSAERVVAIGTTVVRSLESAAATGELSGRTELFIRPGFRFRMVDAMLTNFHMPRSSLLALVCAFAGPRWRDLYGAALGAGYRFLSFGDAMFLPSRADP